LGYSLSMSVPLTLLGLLEREPSHGYDLKSDYDMYFGRVAAYADRGVVVRDGEASTLTRAEP
jgi:DNA-binding PadR family transcriptional regulator